MSGLVSSLGFLLTISLAQTPTVSEGLRMRIEQLHDAPATNVLGARLLRPDAVSHFFQGRNFQPAWDNARARAIVVAIRGIEQDGLSPRDYHLAPLEAAIDAMLAATPPAPRNS